MGFSGDTAEAKSTDIIFTGDTDFKIVAIAPGAETGNLVDGPEFFAHFTHNFEGEYPNGQPDDATPGRPIDCNSMTINEDSGTKIQTNAFTGESMEVKQYIVSIGGIAEIADVPDGTPFDSYAEKFGDTTVEKTAMTPFMSHVAAPPGAPGFGHGRPESVIEMAIGTCQAYWPTPAQ